MKYQPGKERKANGKKSLKYIILLAGIILAVILTVILSWNAIQGSEEDEEYQNALLKQTVNGISLSEMHENIKEAIVLIYSPKSQDDIDIGMEILRKHMTKLAYDNFASGTQSYKNGENSRVKFVKSAFGAKENQSDKNIKHLSIIKVTYNNGYEDVSIKLCVEFFINEQGNIFKYDIY